MVTSNAPGVTAEMKATLLTVEPAAALHVNSSRSTGRIQVKLPTVPHLMRKMADTVSSLSTVTLHSVDRCQRFADVLLRLITRINVADISAMLEEVVEAEDVEDAAIDESMTDDVVPGMRGRDGRDM